MRNGRATTELNKVRLEPRRAYSVESDGHDSDSDPESDLSDTGYDPDEGYAVGEYSCLLICFVRVTGLTARCHQVCSLQRLEFDAFRWVYRLGELAGSRVREQTGRSADDDTSTMALW